MMKEELKNKEIKNISHADDILICIMLIKKINLGKSWQFY